MRTIIGLCGLPGAGKSEAAAVLMDMGFRKIRFGDITDEKLNKLGKEINEENERWMREKIREEHGMEAFAKLNIEKIRKELEMGEVVIDGLRSIEEYYLLKKEFPEEFISIAIYSPPVLRYMRLSKRPKRPLTKEECMSRDRTEIKNLGVGGTIAMADYTVCNTTGLQTLKFEIEKIIKKLNSE